MQKKTFKTGWLNYLKSHSFFYHFYILLLLSFMTSKKFESKITEEQSLKLQTIGEFLYFYKCDQNNILSKPIS